jgi:hypothetical protein
MDRETGELLFLQELALLKSVLFFRWTPFTPCAASEVLVAEWAGEHSVQTVHTRKRFDGERA